MLRPKTRKDSDLLLKLYNTTAAVPMDEYLKLTDPPFKITATAMLEAAFWAQNQCSYQAAEEALFKSRKIRINDDTIRLITNAVGEFVFKKDCEDAKTAYNKMTAGKLSFPYNKPGVLYIKADGAAITLDTKIRMDQPGVKISWELFSLRIIYAHGMIKIGKCSTRYKK